MTPETFAAATVGVLALLLAASTIEAEVRAWRVRRTVRDRIARYGNGRIGR